MQRKCSQSPQYGVCNDLKKGKEIQKSGRFYDLKCSSLAARLKLLERYREWARPFQQQEQKDPPFLALPHVTIYNTAINYLREFFSEFYLQCIFTSGIYKDINREKLKVFTKNQEDEVDHTLIYRPCRRCSTSISICRDLNTFLLNEFERKNMKK